MTLCMSEYSEYTNIQSTVQPEVVSAIQQLELETQVVSKAVQIYYSVDQSPTRWSKTKSIKGTRKLRLIFYCVFIAYKELDHPVDPYHVADKVGLPRGEIDQAFSEYAPPGAIIIEPEKMVRFYAKRLGDLLSRNADELERGAHNVIQVCKSTDAGREWVTNTPAKIVAITAIYHYLCSQNTTRNLKAFEKACYLSSACIRRHHEQVAKYCKTV